MSNLTRCLTPILGHSSPCRSFLPTPIALTAWIQKMNRMFKSSAHALAGSHVCVLFHLTSAPAILSSLPRLLLLFPIGSFFPGHNFLFLFTAAPAAYGGSQARGQIELQLPAYTTATERPDLSHSLRQCWILNPLSEARNPTCVFMDTMLGS